MSQEYTEDKEVTLTKLSSGRRLLEALLILIVLFAVWLMAALLSFNPSDPSWSQTAWHEPIHNLGGMPGAWLADTLFFIFGVMAYTIPVIIVGGCWFAWRHQSSDEYIDYFAVSLRIIGVLALILTSCGLAAINADDIWYFASGGVIGSLLSTTLQPLLHSSGGTIALLCVWAAGLTLFTGWSWVTIAEKLGGWILNILTFASNRTRRDDTWVDEDEYEDDEEYEDENHGKQHESRRARILRGALARRKRLAEKFINPMGRQTDAALFSGKRMDDEEEITYTARGVVADPDDVLFSGNRATQPEYDEYDPLLNGAPITEPVAVAAAATTATQSWAAPVEPVTQTPPVASVDVPPTQPTVAWQPVPGPQTGEPVIAPAPEGYPQQYNIMSRCNNLYSHSSRIMRLQLNSLCNNLTTLLRRNSLRNSRITPLRQNNRWQVTPGKPKSSNPLLLHSLHTRRSKLISSQPLRSRCTNSRNPLNSSLLWSLNPL